MAAGLFREEVIEASRRRLAGDVTIAQPVSQAIISIALIAGVAAASIFLALNSYARKETVLGRLTPTKGIVRVVSPNMATVANVLVAENATVEKGDPLVSLVSERVTADGVKVVDEIVRQLDAEAREVETQLDLVAESYRVLRRENLAELKGVQRRIEPVEKQLAVQRRRLELASDRLDVLTKLEEEDAASAIERDDADERRMLIEQEYQELRETRASMRQSVEQLKVVRERLDSEEQQELSRLRGLLAEIEQRRARAESERNLLLRAPVTGRVAALQAKVGQSVAAGDLQLAILPSGGELVAELFAPTRAAGLVEVGQKVRLLFDAFPYQRFGAGDGVVTGVSKTILFPEDGPEALNIHEPAYRITVALSAQSVTAKGQEFALQDGMTLRADVILERRSILEWMLHPVRSIRQR
ncbi:MAG: HlyD family efflux transporter periplasmic adaptor subunit [Pseudomonadota bacterium]